MSYRELWLFRYTNEGAAGVHSGGFGTRRAVLSEAIAAGGGQVIEFAMLHGDDQWDAMMICEYPERPSGAGMVASDFMARGAGTIAAERVMQLIDPDEVDAHVASLGETSWKPAGS